MMHEYSKRVLVVSALGDLSKALTVVGEINTADPIVHDDLSAGTDALLAAIEFLEKYLSTLNPRLVEK